jgi:hypothetical protein
MNSVCFHNSVHDSVFYREVDYGGSRMNRVHDSLDSKIFFNKNKRLPLIEKSEFICPSIVSEINDVDEKEVQQTFVFNSELNLNVGIWSLQSSKIDHSKLIRRVCRITKWIRRFPQSQYDNSRRWTILLYLNTQPKQWCTSEKVLTPCNVNSGETEFNAQNITIRIFRKEDLFKVLIHELLHACMWDRFVEPRNNHDKWRWMPNEQEAFIEANARYLYCKLLSKWYPKFTFKEYWERELKWMKQQSTTLQTESWTSTTNTIAYYLFTVALLYSPHCEFLSWVYQKSSASSVDKFSNATVKKMNKEWLSLRERWWNLFYKSKSMPQYRSTSMNQSSNVKKCFSMRMVKTQMPF